MRRTLRLALVACGVAAVSMTALALPAYAGEAVVTVGHDDGRFAEPPPREDRENPVVLEPVPHYELERPELYRSPVRLSVGPAAVTTGQNLGLGLGLAADFGTGSVGARIAAAWLRTGGQDPGISQPSSLGTSMGQYTGELTLDLHKRGPVHPVFGIGFGVAHVDKPGGGGSLGIGTARFGIEYALGLDDADVRLGAGVTGVLPGPADREVQDLRAYAIIGAGIGIGF